MILRALKNPKRATIIAVAAFVVITGGFIGYPEYQASRLAKPLFSKLEGLSDRQEQKHAFSLTGSKWSGTFHPKDDKANEGMYDAIRPALISSGWDVSEEGTIIIEGGMKGGFYIVASNNSTTLVAHLPKPGADLQVDIAKTGRPEVSKPMSSLRISGR